MEKQKTKSDNKLREEILERINFLSDHWGKDDKSPFNFGGWREEVVDAIIEIFEKALSKREKGAYGEAIEDIKALGIEKLEQDYEKVKPKNLEDYELQS